MNKNQPNNSIPNSLLNVAKLTKSRHSQARLILFLFFLVGTLKELHEKKNICND